MERLTGTVLWFGTDKQAFGYIYGYNHSSTDQCFVHYKQIVNKNLRKDGFREVLKGDLVSFEIGVGFCGKGTQAMNVELIKQYANNN